MPPVPIAFGENDQVYDPPDVSAAVATRYQTCAPTAVPWFRVWSSCVQAPPAGAGGVTLDPPTQLTCAIRRSFTLTLAGIASCRLAPAAVGPTVPAPTSKDAGSMMYGVESLESSSASSRNQRSCRRCRFQPRLRGETS